MANAFNHVGEAVRESFKFGDAGQRERRLKQLGTEILYSMQPVIGWIERNRPAEKAALVKDRLHLILKEAVECAGLEIPEFAGEAVPPAQGPSHGARRVMELHVTAGAFANSLRGWGGDIREEDKKGDRASGAQLRQGQEPDGPFGTDGFRLNGVEVRFGRAAKQRNLTLALWDCKKSCPRPARPIEEVLTDVYGGNHDTSDATFRQLCADTRRRFQTAGLPLTLENMQGKVRLNPGPA
jgi:hypothetical protein